AFSGACSGATAIANAPLWLATPLALCHTGRAAGALVPALGAVVGDDRRLAQELEARVDLGDAGQSLRGLVEVELQDWEKPLQVGLLVDREVDLALGEQLLGDRYQVVTAALPALLSQTLLLDGLRDGLRRAGVDRE